MYIYFIYTTHCSTAVDSWSYNFLLEFSSNSSTTVNTSPTIIPETFVKISIR